MSKTGRREDKRIWGKKKKKTKWKWNQWVQNYAKKGDAKGVGEGVMPKRGLRSSSVKKPDVETQNSIKKKEKHHSLVVKCMRG